MIPDDFDVISVGDTTRSVCRRLCSETYDLTCSGFLYNRRLQMCELSAYTGEWVPADGPTFNSSSGLEFYRRIRCLGQRSPRVSFFDRARSYSLFRIYTFCMAYKISPVSLSSIIPIVKVLSHGRKDLSNFFSLCCHSK